MKKTIHLEYYASLYEQTGVRQEVLETTANTVADLFAQLKTKYHFAHHRGHLAVSVNCTISKMDCVLHDGDEVVFIPAVAGG